MTNVIDFPNLQQQPHPDDMTAVLHNESFIVFANTDARPTLNDSIEMLRCATHFIASAES